MNRSLPVAALVVLASRITFAQPTTNYVTKPGDTCLSIAIGELGDRARLADLHRLNPNLGPLPHRLVPGTIIQLPAGERGADATLTSARGSVRVRKPTVESWDIAQLGLELFRSWRVGARERSSAELTFRDTSRLYMRENTIVIIYGATASRYTATTAELERGALETRLAQLSGRTLSVKTPSSESVLGEGRALVVVDDRDTTMVANHAAKPARVRGVDARRRARGAPVVVVAGMGSKVLVGALPSPPRKLPPAPTWLVAPPRFVDLGRVGASVRATWNAVPTTARYRVSILASDGRDLAAVEVPATAQAFELHRLPPGSYLATIATIDVEGFESAPSVPYAFAVTPVDVIAPGTARPVAPTPPAADMAIELRLAPAPLRVALGSRIIAAQGETCGGAQEFDVAEPTRTSIACHATDGAALPPVGVHIVSPRACFGTACSGTVENARIARSGATRLHYTFGGEATLGPAITVRGSQGLTVVSAERTADGLDVVVLPTAPVPHGQLSFMTASGFVLVTTTVDIDPSSAPDRATVVAPRARTAVPRWELGAFAGYWLIGAGSQLGNPTDPAFQIATGPSVGARAGWWWRPWIGIEAELQVASPGRRSAPGGVAVIAPRARIAVRHLEGRFEARLTLGAGFAGMVEGGERTSADIDGQVEIGGTVALELVDRWWLRFDVRDVMATIPGRLVHGAETNLGVARTF